MHIDRQMFMDGECFEEPQRPEGTKKSKKVKLDTDGRTRLVQESAAVMDSSLTQLQSLVEENEERKMPVE